MSNDKFSLSVEEKNGIVILKTNGYINNVAGEQIADSCYKSIDEGKKKFLLDLENSSIVNSIGVSIIIEIIERLQEVDGHIGYYNLAPIVAKTFKIMGLVQYSTIYESEEEAITDMEGK
jgi:anti-sigma B factor antagonist